MKGILKNSYYKSLLCSYKLATDSQKKRQYYLAYTLCFIILFLLVFVWFWSEGKTFIWKEDGTCQHLTALLYYGKYLRKIIRALLHGKLILPEWDFTLGEGSDILQTLHFYVMGDPLTLLSAFVPSAYTWCLYNALVVLRMYLSGITFSVFCFETGQKKRLAVLSGCLVYVFCYWAIYNAARHPLFLTPMIYFPLVLSGVEKIIKGKSPWLFTSAVFLAAISQFYFFYMIVLLTVVYVIARLIPILRTNSKTAFIRLSQIAFYAVIGTTLSAIITLPVLYSFMNSARMEVENPYFILYPLSYYENLLGSFLSSKDSYWLCMGYSSIALPSLLLLFVKRKKNVFVKVFFLIGVFIILCPFLGKALNGFSYHSNRWCWAFALVCAYTVTTTWEDMFNLSIHEMRYLCCALAIYLFVCLLLKKPSYEAETMANICIAMLIVVILVLHSTRALGMRTVHVQLLVLFLAGTSIVSHGYWKHAPSAGNYASQGLAVQNVSSIIQPSETEAVKKAAKKYDKKSSSKGDFYRYSGEGLAYNAATYASMHSTSFFWSISNPYTTNFRKELGLTLNNTSYKFLNYYGRTSLTTLASVLYYVVPNNAKKVPYGFKYLSKTDKHKVYYNEHRLPLAYTYKHSIGVNDWNKWDEIRKQELMLSYVLIDDAKNSSVDSQINISSQSLKYDITCDKKGIFQKKNSFVVTNSNASVKLTFEGIPLSENYLVINGLNYNELNYDSNAVIRQNPPANYINIKVKASNGDSKTFAYRTPYNSFYEGQKNFAVCLNYSEKAINSITITFPKTGIYSFDEILVISYPLDNYADKVNELKKDTFKKLSIGTDSVSASISLDEDKWLCFSIPYSKGWEAFVNGKKTELVIANLQYMAVRLSAGEHIINLKYRTPFLRLGAIISLFGATTAAVTFIAQKKLRASAT